jgi:hypothetical protein
MLGDIYEWYVSNIKNGPKQPKVSTAVTAASTGVNAVQTHSENQFNESALSFSLWLDLSNGSPSCSLCPRATFNEGWLRNQGSCLFRCVCGYGHELEFTCKLGVPLRKDNFS